MNKYIFILYSNNFEEDAEKSNEILPFCGFQSLKNPTDGIIFKATLSGEPKVDLTENEYVSSIYT